MNYYPLQAVIIISYVFICFFTTSCDHKNPKEEKFDSLDSLINRLDTIYHTQRSRVPYIKKAIKAHPSSGKLYDYLAKQTTLDSTIIYFEQAEKLGYNYNNYQNFIEREEKILESIKNENSNILFKYFPMFDLFDDDYFSHLESEIDSMKNLSPNLDLVKTHQTDTKYIFS